MGLHPSLYWSRRLLLSSSPGTPLSPPLFYFSRSLSRSPPRSSFHSQIPTTVTVPVPHSFFFFPTPFLATLSVCLVTAPLGSALHQCSPKAEPNWRCGGGWGEGEMEGGKEGGVVSPGPPPLIRDDRLRRCGSDPGGGSALTFFFPAFDQPQLEVALFAASQGARWRQCGQPGVTMGSGGGNECPCLFLGNSKKAVVARKRKKKTWCAGDKVDTSCYLSPH